MIPTRAMSFGRSAACLMLALTPSLTAVHPAAAEIVNRIVATVDGDPITAHQVRRYGEERRAHGVAWETLLEAVITDKILEKEIAARKITARSEDIDRYLGEVLTRNKMTPEQFAAALKQQGVTMEQYKARIKGEIERTQLIGQDLRGGNPEVSDEDVRKYYEAHKAEWGERSAVTVRDIFLQFQPGMTQRDAMRTVEQARALKKAADEGQPFEGLARRYSQGPGAENGGLLGTFKKGEMAPQLEQVVFALREGEVSQPMVGPQGVHLLKLDRAQSSGSVELDQVKDEIRQVLANQALDERFRDWIAKNLRERHHVEVLN
jgi:peptidyl-prolyl cis-trans isomerase SurA